MRGNHHSDLLFFFFNFLKRLLFLFLKLFPIVHNQILLYDQYGEKNKQNEEKPMHEENKYGYYFVYLSYTHLIFKVFIYLIIT